MTEREMELNIIEAAVDVADWQRALDAGNPAQKHLSRSVDWLTSQVQLLEAEHEGRWQRPDEGE